MAAPISFTGWRKPGTSGYRDMYWVPDPLTGEPPAFNLNPAPRTGKGPYGLVPGAQGLPDPAGDLAAQFPGLDQNNSQISQNIMAELSGELPQDVIDAIQDESARFGITSGMPGSDLARRKGARNLGLTTLGLQQHGLQDYLGATKGIKDTQTVDPALQAQIAAYNAVLNSAPDPGAAASQLRSDFQSGFGAGGGGGGGGTTRITPPNLTAPGPFGNPKGAPGQTPSNPFLSPNAAAYTTYPGSGNQSNPWSFNPGGQGTDWVNAGNIIPFDGGYGGGGAGDQGPQDPFWDDFWSNWDNSFDGGVETEDDIWASLGA